MSKVQSFVDQVNRIVENMPSWKRRAIDGHCTFGYEFRFEEEKPIYFVTLDLEGSFFWTGNTMDEALRKAQAHLDRR